MSRSILCAALLGIFAAGAAEAADKQWCADYAHKAVDQYNQASQHDECQKYIKDNGLRWQPSFENHYKGCMMFGQTLSESEQSTREGQLLDCARGG